jgi:hypothetical protein
MGGAAAGGNAGASYSATMKRPQVDEFFKVRLHLFSFA